jgi:type II secretory pathway pseudopilin PulG
MKRARHQRKELGFSLIEMMIAAVIFILLCGAAFALLSVAQQRYQTESQVLNSFQEARFGLDEIVRDVNGSGYPPLNQFSIGPTPPPETSYAITPVAWSSGYPNSPCQIGTGGGGSCVTPGDFDLIIERDVDPWRHDGVEWTRYQLQTPSNILSRSQTSKAGGGADPAGATQNSFVPYVQNVMNNDPTLSLSPTQLAQFKAAYPSMFPSGNPVPVFSYTCYTPYGPQPCVSAGSYNSPMNVTDIEITLIVMTPTKDAQTGQLRLIELHGRGHSLNPVQH